MPFMIYGNSHLQSEW